MSTIKYNKIVRERMPEIIELSGKTCTTEILSDEEYLRMIDAKLDPFIKSQRKINVKNLRTNAINTYHLIYLTLLHNAFRPHNILEK